MALLEVRQLVKKYGPRKVVDGVSFDVNPGEIVGLLGPNGAGKTTSFRMATGQISPNSGEVWFDGKEVTLLPMYQRARLGMGYLSQEPSIFRKLTVEKNILAILEALPRSRTLKRKLTRKERWQRTDAVLARFKLEHVRKNAAAKCSGGEKRRLEIARCLVCEPLLILLDEPLAAVDPLTKEDIRKNIRELATQGIGILLTDHDVREVMKIADRAYVIIDGKVVASGTPHELKRNKLAVDGYLGSTFEDEVQRQDLEELPMLTRVSVPVLVPPQSSQPEVITPPGLSNLHQSVEPQWPVETSEKTIPQSTIPEPQPVYAETTQPEQAVAQEPPASPVPPPVPSPFTISELPAPTRPPMPEPLDLPPLPSPRVPVASAFPLFGSSAPGQFSGVAQQLLEQEKMRRLVDLLGDSERWNAAWHELNMRGLSAVPILLEALERRDVQVRHLSFRLLEQITGETLQFDTQAPDEIRLRQVAHLRARFEFRKSA